MSWLSIAAVHAAQAPSGNDVSARLFNSADVTVPNMNPGEWTSLTFNSERWDMANLDETATNSGRLKTPVAGNYYIFANITWEAHRQRSLGAASAIEWEAVIAEQRLPKTVAPFRVSMSVGTLYSLAAGDYVEAQVFRTAAIRCSFASIPATSPEFGMAKLP